MVGVWLSAKENNTYTIKMTGQLNVGGTRNKGKAMEERGGSENKVDSIRDDEDKRRQCGELPGRNNAQYDGIEGCPAATEGCWMRTYLATGGNSIDDIKDSEGKKKGAWEADG